MVESEKSCSKCAQPAVIFIRYNGLHLCRDHFSEFVLRRVKREAKKQGRLRSGERVGVAVSGGKDSIVALHIMHDLIASRPDVSLVCLTVDEGIAGYRDKSIDVVSKNCKLLGVELSIVSFSDLVGFSMDEIASFGDVLGECSYCGVFRRFCLNTLAKELNVTRLVTGHNLDDMAQSVLMNVVNGDVAKMARLGPHLRVREGLIPRKMPLRLIPEKETMLYAIINGFEFFDGECPYAVSASRGYYRDVVDKLEFENPGSRHGLVKSYDAIKQLLHDSDSSEQTVELVKCRLCGEPASQQLCKSCEMQKRLKLLSEGKSL